jgi:hypothetical protein
MGYNPKSYNKRWRLELINPYGEVLRYAMLHSKPEQERIIGIWKKLYGKKFETLIIKEIRQL